MQGNIRLESEFGRGTKFTIVLPDITNKAVEIHTSEKATKRAKKLLQPEPVIPAEDNKLLILIVEDNKVNQKLARSILKEFYEIDSALDGETAITMVAKKQYDAILMDIHLGEGLDGIQVTNIIRNDIRYKYTPIIAVTGYTMIGDKEHILNQGCSHYLSKPFNKQQLLDIVELALEGIKS